RLHLERHRLADRRLVDRVHALEPVADPARADLEDDDAELRKLVEHTVLEERRESFANDVAEHDVLEERGVRAGHLSEAVRRGPVRLEARMDPERKTQILCRGEHTMMIGMSVHPPAPDERRHPEALHAVASRAA